MIRSDAYQVNALSAQCSSAVQAGSSSSLPDQQPSAHTRSILRLARISWRRRTISWSVSESSPLEPSSSSLTRSPSLSSPEEASPSVSDTWGAEVHRTGGRAFWQGGG